MLFTTFTITCDRAQLLADSDECLIDGSCDQLCFNKDGTFDCQCVSGYEKSGPRCTAVNGMCISLANNIFLLVSVKTK
jgi:hypothetical protein